MRGTYWRSFSCPPSLLSAFAGCYILDLAGVDLGVLTLRKAPGTLRKDFGNTGASKPKPGRASRIGGTKGGVDLAPSAGHLAPRRQVQKLASIHSCKLPLLGLYVALRGPQCSPDPLGGLRGPWPYRLNLRPRGLLHNCIFVCSFTGKRRQPCMVQSM